MGGGLWRDVGARPPKARNAAQQTEWVKHAAKDDNIILNELRRQLDDQAAEHNLSRDTKHLHASEICKPGWCPRASWYRLTGVQADHSSTRQISANVAAEGNDIHERHQTALWRLGILTGEWKCLVCRHRWWATSPESCPHCASLFIRYNEVPIEDESIHLLGRGDGLVETERRGQVLLEVKSVGLGSVRIEAPALYQRLKDGEVDLNGLWQLIRRPFPTHVRQAMLYLRARKLRTAVMLYECKWNQQLQEFAVRYTPETIEHIVDGAKAVKRALDDGGSVRRPEWAEETAKTCTKCEFYKTCWKVSDDVVEEGQPAAKPVRLFKSS